MKVVARRDAMIERLKECLTGEEVSFAFLFGSWARGEVFQDSDADVAVYFQGDYCVERVKKIWGKLEAAAEKEVDLVVLNQASSLVAYEAIRGKPLVIKDRRLFLEFMLRVSTEAEDFRNLILDLWRWRQKIRRTRMNPLDELQKASIVRRIEFIKEESADLNEYEALDFKTYSADRKKRREVERIIENIANAVIDIGKILLVGEEAALPDTYREIFCALSQRGIVNDKLSVRLSDLVRLRNVLAHQYLDIKWDLIRDFLKQGQNDLDEFLSAIEKKI